MNKKINKERESLGRTEKDICPNCSSESIERVEENYKFMYGIGDDAVELSAIVPIIKCSDCGEGFLDYVAEDICHEAVCEHLGVMTPSRVKDLRKMYKLTQAEFAEITELGEATLSRWERGIVIQNKAYDNYLYLLHFPENLDRLRSHSESVDVERSVETDRTCLQEEPILTRKISDGSPGFQFARAS